MKITHIGKWNGRTDFSKGQKRTRINWDCTCRKGIMSRKERLRRRELARRLFLKERESFLSGGWVNNLKISEWQRRVLTEPVVLTFGGRRRQWTPDVRTT